MSYIALEGIEGAGKSTIRPLLGARLRSDGFDVVEVREPGGTATGEAIRGILLDSADEVSPWTEALLFAAARAQLAAELIGPALAFGRTVIGDRSVYSSIAYQGGGRGLGIAEVRSVNAAGLGGVWPHIVVLLRLEADTGLGRQEVADRIGAEGREFMARVVATYDELAAAEPDRFVVVDAARPIAEVVDVVHDAVGQRR